ncbi:MAG: integration host factor subunit beta [Gammaproteobacteria bacterium RIFCSPHIGHO2_12_FULL_35_23]|nr:MAG: integration host factor subunit beta [Gammaproteobacteria bacterium RIFCSPHIGHO2_12_FULL_35_23]
MIKSELVEVVGRKQDQLSEQDVTVSINTVLDKMAIHLSQGGRIEIRGFGSFSLHYRPPRQAHNPKTGEKLVTPPKYAVHFKPGKELRESINASKDIPIQQDLESDEENE